MGFSALVCAIVHACSHACVHVCVCKIKRGREKEGEREWLEIVDSMCCRAQYFYMLCSASPYSASLLRIQPVCTMPTVTTIKIMRFAAKHV